MIHDFSQGVPRLINAACDRCLLAEYAKRSGKVSLDTAQAVLAEFARLHSAPKLVTAFRRPFSVGR
jgi:hypothetical protein